MRKILYISNFNSEILKTDGVSKKVKTAIETFKKFGYEVDYTDINEKGVYIQTSKNRYLFCEREKTNHSTFVSFYKKMIDETPEYDIIYFRYGHISFEMLSFFKKFKKGNRKMIFGELPTYMGHPYKESSLRHKILFYFKRIFDTFIPKKIDYLVTFSDHRRLFGLNTINIENFVDIDNLKIKKINTTIDTECHILSLAHLTPAHGVDLIIEGLYEYYKSNNHIKCYLHIVGGGPLKSKLESLVHTLDLKEYVLFHGVLGGDDLDNIFDICDIGAGAIAIFRKGSVKLSELKIREYTARGLPFFYNAKEPQFDNQFFCKKIPFENKATNIYSIVDFYQKLPYNNMTLEKMRDFAEQNLTADIQLLPIHKAIEQFYSNDI